MEKARREFTASSTEDNRIMLDRSLSSAGRFREAIAVYTNGLREYPDSPLFYRLRGHRYMTIRQFGRTVADLKKAAALIQARPPAGRSGGLLTPAERVAPETRFVIYYHLGLACYLARDFAKAEAAYRECFKWSKGDDVIVAVDVNDGCQEGDSQDFTENEVSLLPVFDVFASMTAALKMQSPGVKPFSLKEVVTIQLFSAVEFRPVEGGWKRGTPARCPSLAGCVQGKRL